MFGTLGWFFNRKLVSTIAVLSITAAALLFAEKFSSVAAQTTFPGAGAGPIPDGGAGCAPSPGAPLNITFNVTGISTAPSNVSVDFTSGTPNHTFIGDLTVVLLAPNGASHSIFGRTGATTATAFGSASDLGAGALYTFNNAAANNWWTSAAVTPVPAGNYRTSNSGGAGATNPMPNTDINAAFAAIPTSNGTWTLRFTDGCGADTGNVSAANLTLTAAVAANGSNDINGDGKSDFLIVRADGPVSLSDFIGVNDFTGKDKIAARESKSELAPQVTGVGWWTLLNNGTTPNRVGLGADTDFFFTNDFDNDGKDDLTVWSPGAAGVAGYKILKSSTSTVSTRLFGQSGDIPDLGGDFNGDGKGDLSVYRGGAQSVFYWADETTPSTVNFIPWGTTGDFSYLLDYDGDGKSDVAVQRNGGGGAAQHWIRQSSNGAAVLINYGLSSDFVIPGDYDGDGRDDIMISRNANFGTGTFKYFWIRESDGGGTPESPVQWGITGDVICEGDWDGDGKNDIAVWRPNANPDLNFFYVRRSSDGALMAQEWGQSGDVVVNNWNVH